MILSNIIWIICFFVHHCSALSPQEITFLEQLDLGSSQINIEDYLNSNEENYGDQDTNSTERFPHGRVRRSVQEYGSHNPIKGKFSRWTISSLTPPPADSIVDYPKSILPVISNMVYDHVKTSSFYVTADFLLKTSDSRTFLLEKDESRPDFVYDGRGSAEVVANDKGGLVQILKGKNGLMQLNVYSNVYSINVPTIVKRIYFTDGAAVGDDSGTVRLATFIGKNGCYLTITYPKADGSQILRIYFTDFDQELEPVSSSRIEHFSGTEDLKDIAMFTAGDSGYLAIARGTKSLLFKFSDEKSDAKLKLDSTFPAALKVFAHQSSYETRLIWIKEDQGQVKTSEWIFSFGLFVQDPDRKDVTEGTVEDKFHVVPLIDSDDKLFAKDRSMLMRVSGNTLIFSQGRTLELPAEASVHGAQVLGVGWEYSNPYVYVGIPSLSKTEVHAYKLVVDKDEFDASYINKLHKDVTNFFDKTDRLNTQLEEMSDTLKNPGNGFISIVTGDVQLSKLRVKNKATFADFNQENLLKVELNLKHDSKEDVLYSHLNYKDTNSKLAILSKESTLGKNDEGYLLKNIIMKDATDPITIKSGTILTVDKVYVKNAEIDEIRVKTVTGPVEGREVSNNVNDFLTKSLKVGDPSKVQSFKGPVSFSSVSATNVKFEDEAGPSVGSYKVEPHKMLALDAVNTLEKPMKFNNVHLKAASSFPGTINDIRIADIVPVSSKETVTVSGEKTFSKGLKASGETVEVTFINDKLKEDVLDPKFVLLDPGLDEQGNPKTQSIQTKMAKFANLIVKNNLIVNKMNDVDIRPEVLSNIVRTDQESKVKGKTIFTGDVTINNLESKDVNEVDPEHMLINGVDQEYPFPLKFDNLIITDDFQSTYINNIKLDSDVARTDQDNTFETAITFGDLAVKTKADAAKDVTIDNVDISELTDPIQKYTGEVTITKGLYIDQDDVKVTKMDIGSFKDQSMAKDHLADLFLYKDTNQVLPNLKTIGSQTTGIIDDLHVMKTLDGLDLTDDVMHNAAKDEKTNANVQFIGGPNKVYKKMTIVDNIVGGVNIANLYSNIYCKDDGTTIYNGKKTLAANTGPEVVSLFDVDIDTKASFNNRDFVSGGTNHFINKNTAHTFSGDMTFNKKLEISGNLQPVGHVSSANDDVVTLNDKVVKKFDSDIVKKSSSYTGTISTPVTMAARMASNKKMTITESIGVVDDKNIFTYLNERVLLDEDHKIDVKLTAPNLNFKKGITINPEPQDKAYFCGKDLVSYKNSLYASTGVELSGDKYVKGDITVKQNLVFPSDKNPFGVDLQDLQSKALSKTKDQTISVPYEINSVSSVDQMTVKKVDGVKIDDLCRIDAKCDIVCDESLNPCVHFKKGLTANGGISFDKLEEITIADAISKLDTNNNDYNLDLLKISAPNGDFDWTTDNAEGSVSVSNLYDKLVVKSNKKWASRTKADTINQDITGDTTIDGKATFTTMNLNSGIVNADLSNEFKFDEILTDAAKKTSANTFTTDAVKTFTKEVKAKEANIKRLKDVINYDQIVLQDYRNNMLVLDDEENPGSVGFSQTISQPWSLSNGIKVENRLKVKEEIDGVQVEDLVLKNKISTKEIPKVTFNEDITVKGNVITKDTVFSTTLDSFMNNRVKLDSSDTIPNNLKLTGSVSLKSGVDAIVTKLNDIPANTWVKSGIDVDTKQVITGKKIISSTDTKIYGNLITNSISTAKHDNVDLSVKYADALKLDEDATIAGPNLVFKKETHILGEEISGDMSPAFADCVPSLITDMEPFVKSLHSFYNDHIVEVIPKLDKETRIANKLGLGKLGYLEETKVPEYLSLKAIDPSKKVVLTSALELEENVFSINAKTVSECTWDNKCECESTFIASPLDSAKSPSVDVDDRVFTFSLNSGTFTVSTNYESYEGCVNEDEVQPGSLVVSGFFPEDDVMKLRLNQLSHVDIGTTFPFQDLATMESIGHVRDVVMWEMHNVVYLAVASVYNGIKVAVFELDTTAETMTWKHLHNLAEPDTTSIGFASTKRLKVFQFVDSNVEIAHLYVVRVSSKNAWAASPDSDVLVYKQTATKTSPTFESQIPCPGFRDFDVFKFFPAKPPTYEPNELIEVSDDVQPQIMMTIASNQNLDFMTNFASLSTWIYEPSTSKFEPAIVPNVNHEIKSDLVGIEVDKISDRTVFVIAEKSWLHVYRFVPFQGLFLIDSIPGNQIMDFAVFKKDHFRDSLNIFVVEENNESKMYRLTTKDYVPKITMSYGRLD